LIEASLDPMVAISPGGKITDVNEALVKATGVDREKLIGTDFSEYFTEPDKARDGYQKVFAEGFVADLPLTIRHNLRDVYTTRQFTGTRMEECWVYLLPHVISQTGSKLKKN